MAFEDIRTEGPRPLGFVLSEAEAGRSRDEVTILSGSGVLLPGTVLGKVTASEKFTPAADASVDGSETAVAVLAYGVDATDTDVPGVVISRAAQVKKPELIYDDGATETDMDAGLVAVGIIPR